MEIPSSWEIAFIQNVNFHIGFIVFVFGFRCNCPSSSCHKRCPLGKGWAKFVCRADGCNALYTTNYNLVWHLWAHHNVTMASLDTHLLGSKAQRFKIVQQWMCGSWATLWPDSIIMNRRQLLRLGSMLSWSGISSKAICNTHLRFLSRHLLS